MRTIEFLRSIILARLLMPEVFGIMSIAGFVINGFEAMTESGYGAALIYRRETSREAYDTAWVISVVRGVLLAGATMAAAPVVASFYSNDLLAALLRVTAFWFIIGGFDNINLVRLRRDLDFKRISLMELLAALGGAINVVFWAYWLRSVWALAIGMLFAKACRVVLSYVAQREWPRFSFSLSVARDIFRYSRFVTAAGILVFLALEVDNAIVGRLLGMTALGFYALAYNIANLPATHISYLISNIMFPSYSQLQGDRDRLRAAYLKVLKATSLLAVPAAAGLIVLAPDLVCILYGQKWLPMVGALQILCVHGGLRSLTAASGPLYLAIGKPNISFYVNLLRIAVILVLIFPLSTRLGIEGVSIAVSLAIGAQLVLSWRLITSLLDIRLRTIIQSLWLSGAAAAVMVAGLFVATRLFGLSNLGLLGLLVQVGLGIALYAGCLLALDKSLLAWFKGLNWNVTE